MDRIEVITSVERRRRWSAAEKARLVAAMNEPGAVGTEIARNAEVCASLLYRWRRELIGRCTTPAFVPVRVALEAGDEGPASAPACTSPSSPAPSPSPARSTITIAFGDEVRLTIEGAPDASTLAKVIGALTAGPLSMIAFPSGARVWLATGHTDMRKGFGSLALMVQEGFKRDPHGGDLVRLPGTQGRPDQADLARRRRRVSVRELPDFILHLLPLKACILNRVSCETRPRGRRAGSIDCIAWAAGSSPAVRKDGRDRSRRA